MKRQLDKRVAGAAVLGAALLAGCAPVPRYERPALDLPAHYAEAQGWVAANPADSAPRGPWWSAFGDPELDRLEARVDVSSQTVRKALAGLRQARSLLEVQRGARLPTVTASAGIQASHVAANRADSAQAGHTLPDHTLGIDVGWDPDLSGRIGALTEAAQADAQASRADLEAVRLAVQVELANDYFMLRSLDRQARLLNDTIVEDGKALAILEQQVAHGAIDDTALAEQQEQLESLRVQAADVTQQRAVLQHALATLVGQPASTFTLAPQDGQGAVAPAVPPGLPAQLLERRPDIAVAERRVAAANADIGVAQAAYYPDLQLGADAGLESSRLAHWLSAPSLFWAAGPQLAAMLFDGGRRAAQVDASRAQYEATAAAYRQTVLTAIQQVEDALAVLAALRDEQDHQARATAAAGRSLALSSDRYAAGAVSYLEVATARTVALQDRRLDEQIGARRLTATVSLIAALGGQWRTSSPP